MNFKRTTDNQDTQASDRHQDVFASEEALTGTVPAPSCELFEGGLGI